MDLDIHYNHPSIIYKNKEFYQIACRNCEKPDDFVFYSDGDKFILVCKCNHIIEINVKNLINLPDKKT